MRKRGNHPKSLERNISIKWVQITFSLSLSIRLVSSSSPIIIISLQKHPPLLALRRCGRFACFAFPPRETTGRAPGSIVIL